MPVKKIIKPAAPKSKLSDWLLKNPLKFAGLNMLLGAIWLGLVGIAGAMINSPQPPAWIATIFAVLLVAIPVFSICKLTKWSKTDSLDRRSFIAVYIGAMLAALAIYAIIIGSLAAFYGLNAYLIAFGFALLPKAAAILIAIVVALIGLFFVGILVEYAERN